MIDHVDNIPNPFNPATNIKYELLVSGKVEIIIYDIMGRKVRTLFDGAQDAGLRSVFWDSSDDNGTDLGTGFYFYTIKSGADSKKGRMLLLKWSPTITRFCIEYFILKPWLYFGWFFSI